MATHAYDIRSLESLLEESQTHLPQTERTAISRDLNGLIQQTSELSSTLQLPYRHEYRMDAVLAARGFDNERHRRTLQGVLTSRVFSEPPQAVHVVDIGQFLNHRHNMILITAIEEAKKKTLEQHEESYTRTLDDEWAEAKQDLASLLGQRRGHATIPLVQPVAPPEAAPLALPQPRPPSASPWPSAAPTARPSVMDVRMKAYAERVKELAAAYARGEESGESIAKFREGCAKAAQSVATTVERQRLVSECWDILKFLTEDDRPLGGLPMALDDPASAAMRIVRASRACLEAQYYQYMRTRLTEAGHPATLSTRQVVTTFRSEMHPTHRGPPVWAHVYYGLRAGLADVAVGCAEEGAGVVPAVVKAELRRYGQAGNRQLHEPSEGMKGHFRDLQSQWAAEPQLASDPFEVAVYLLLNRGEFHKALIPLLKTCQDFLWFKLCHVNGLGEPGPTPTPGSLRAFQAQLLTESAAPLKQQTEDRLLWFKALLHAGLLAEAIHHLMTEIDGFQVEAVHFALALHGARLLPIAAKVEDPLLAQGKVNLPLVVHEYCKFIAPTNAREAVAYYTALGRDHEATSDGLIVNLAIDQGFHVELFPWSEISDPYGQLSAVEALLGRERVTQIAARAADRAHALGKYPAMIDMYLVAMHLSRGMEIEMRQFVNAVLEQINKLLSCVLQIGSPNRAEYLVLAQKVSSVLAHLNAHRLIDSQSGRFATFQMLLAFADFFQAVRDEADVKALQIAENCNVLPLTDADISTKVKYFRESLDESVKRDFGSFVLGVLHLLRRRKILLFQSGVHGDEVMEVKRRAKFIMNFVGQSGILMSIDVQKRMMDLQSAIAE